MAFPVFFPFQGFAVDLLARCANNKNMAVLEFVDGTNRTGRSILVKTIISSFGNILEWFDFAVFGMIFNLVFVPCLFHFVILQDFLPLKLVQIFLLGTIST
jgi:hypothetical protein